MDNLWLVLAIGIPGIIVGVVIVDYVYKRWCSRCRKFTRRKDGGGAFHGNFTNYTCKKCGHTYSSFDIGG